MDQTALEVKFNVLVICGFIFATIVGTVSHEYGHIAVAKFLGYDTKLHYNKMSYTKSPYYLHQNVVDSLTSDEFEPLKKERVLESHWITLGGPIQTILVGVMGFVILWFRRKKRLKFDWKDWVSVFLTFFLARQVFNFVVQILFYVNTGEHQLSGDEVSLAQYLEWPMYSIAFSTCLFSILLCCITVFIFMPKLYRIRFIFSGVLGCGIGYFVWMVWLGPVLLP
jgi:hypothetical protein